MKSTSEGNVLWTGVAAIVAGVLLFLSNLFSEFLLPGEKDGEIVRLGLGLVYIAAYGVGAVALVLALRGLSTLHRRRGELTRAGHNGLRVAAAGAALQALFAAVYFATAAATGDAVDAAFFLYALGFLLLIGGTLAAGVSMIRTAVQRPVGTLLLVAGAMAIVTIVTPAPVHDVGLFLFDAVWIGLGLALTRHSSPVSMRRVATMASIVALAATLVPAAGAEGTGPPTDMQCGDTITPRERGFPKSPLPDSNRRPLLTMPSRRQLVATGGNGLGLREPFSGLSDLPPVATGCPRSAR